MLTANEKAFLDMIAYSEIGPELLALSDNGYNVIVGSTPKNPLLFTSYADHPRRLITLRPGLKSTAAGRYQLLSRYFDSYKKQLHLRTFRPPRRMPSPCSRSVSVGHCLSSMRDSLNRP